MATAVGFISKGVSSGKMKEVSTGTRGTEYAVTDANAFTTKGIKPYDAVTAATTGSNATTVTSLLASAPDQQIDNSIWGAGAYNRTKNRLLFLGNNTLN